MKGWVYSACEVCNWILSTRFRGRCPFCWPAFNATTTSEDMPPLDQILGTWIRLRSSVPCQPRDLWSRRLNAALMGFIAHSDIWAWVDILSLPSLVIPFPMRACTSRTRRSTKEIRRRCQDWLERSPPGTLGPAPTCRKLGFLPEAEQESCLDDRTAAAVHTLIKEGPVRRGCAALTSEPHVGLTQEVVEERRRLHPGPSAADDRSC